MPMISSGRIALDALGAGVPTDDMPAGIEHDDGVVRDAFHQQAEAVLAAQYHFIGFQYGLRLLPHLASSFYVKRDVRIFAIGRGRWSASVASLGSPFFVHAHVPPFGPSPSAGGAGTRPCGSASRKSREYIDGSPSRTQSSLTCRLSSTIRSSLPTAAC